MFSQLGKLFDAGFVVGFFLPTVLFAGASVLLVSLFDPATGQRLGRMLATDLLQGLGVAALACSLGAVWLVAANRQIFRFKEGYGAWSRSWNPLRPLALRLRGEYRLTEEELPSWARSWNILLAWQARRLRQLERRIAALVERREELLREGREPPPELVQEYQRRTEQRVTHFPDRTDLLLPFAFGNTLRAFESYPRVMYGFDPIAGWGQFLGVVPAEYRQHLDGAKSQVDFLINVWFLSHLLLAEYAVLAWRTGSWGPLWFPPAAALSAVLAAFWARQAAVQWGALFKAAFDLYLPDLRRTLGLPRPSTREDERRQWEALLQATYYQLPDRLPEPAAAAEPGSGEPGSSPRPGAGDPETGLSPGAAPATADRVVLERAAWTRATLVETRPPEP